ncbi:hypothetical protein [Nocardia inohanensis]|uniref:hypothetical protein n=1 Tax=Nocardia inohanensis TaxID=209246 RepID=UPI000A4D5BFA|nr:hypothetical protein [Nocardia inohanensis]
MASTDFRTFCHISEYGPVGYGNLHRMIAASRPLVLWAPSTVLLNIPECTVGTKVFLDLMNRGDLRIHARESWIMSSAFRDNHYWAGAKWTRGVDDVIRRIAEEDKDKADIDKRVRIVPPAQGKERAQEYLTENPRVIGSVTRAARRGGAIPDGVLETAHRLASDPRGVAEAVFQQAFNHAEAYCDSAAEAPFFLSQSDSRFLKWMSEVHPGESESGSIRRAQQRRANYAELATQLRRLLRTLETSGTVDHISGFVRSDAHDQLISWFSSLCRSVAYENPDLLDDKVFRELSRQLDTAELKNTLRSWVAKPDSVIGFTGGAITAAGGLVFDGVTQWAIAGGFFAALPVGKGLLQRLGYIPAEYTGPQWPFIYAFGKPASNRRIRRLNRALALQPRGNDY